MIKLKNLLVIILSLSLFSCELHEQLTKTQDQRERAEVNLGVISTLSKGVTDNNLQLIVTTLNSGNYDINIVDETGELLVNKAIRSNRFIITQLLIENGADPSLKDGNGESGKDIIAGSSDELEWLALFDGQKLSTSFATNKLFAILSETKQTNEEVQFPLIKGFFQLGAEVNGRNESQYTPLMVAASNGVLQVVDYLCSFESIDPNVVVERGRGRRKVEFTALSLATQAGHSQVVSALVACGAVK